MFSASCRTPFAFSRAGPRKFSGSAWSFVVALLIIVIWGATGHIFHYSDTWQLIINTGTTIVTFLMVFLIQNTQNRDSKAVHLKLDELIRAVGGARNTMVDLERMSDEELKAACRRSSSASARKRIRPTAGSKRSRKRSRKKFSHAEAGPASSGRASPLRMNTFPLGQSRRTSQCRQSGRRAKQRRRPCQMSQ